MPKIKELTVRYLTDQAGNKTDVVLPLETFEMLMEDLADLAIVAERREAPSLTHEEVLEQLREDGLLQD